MHATPTACVVDPAQTPSVHTGARANSTHKHFHAQVITPYEREIYVITMIKVKITEHCDKLAAGEDSTFGA